MNPKAVDLSVCIGDLGYGQPISTSVFYSGIIFLAVLYSGDISASADEAITYLMICAIVNTGPLSFGFGSFSERKIWAPALLQDFDSLRNPASACASNIMSLFRKRIPSSDYVAT